MSRSHLYAWDSLDDAFGQDTGTGGSDSFATTVFTSMSPVAPVLTDTLYLTETGNTNAISVNDLHQDGIGDCFLISSIGEEALFHPTAITNMIHLNANGTETVTLYTAANGRLPTFGTTSFEAISITVTNTFASNSVNSLPTQDVLGNQKEIWPQVLEKAVATLDGGYGVISAGGNPMIAMEELTGQKATDIAPAALTLASLENDIGLGDLITMDTSTSAGLPYGLVSDHAYMFEKLSGTGSSATVQLGNPWGFDQPAAIPLVQLARSGITEVDIGHIG